MLWFVDSFLPQFKYREVDQLSSELSELHLFEAYDVGTKGYFFVHFKLSKVTLLPYKVC